MGKSKQMFVLVFVYGLMGNTSKAVQEGEPDA
jgi:hypothetical protein